MGDDRVIPTTTTGLLFFLAAISPGYLYQRLAERRLERGERSAWLQAVDLLCIGATCTLLGVFAVLALGEFLPDIVLGLNRVAVEAGSLINEPWLLARSLLLALLASNLIAVALALSVARIVPRARFGHGSVWTTTLTRYQRPRTDESESRTALYLVAQLNDGRSIGGEFLYAERGNDPDRRDIALAAPLWMSESDSRSKTPLSYEFVILKDRCISSLWGRRIEVPSQSDVTSGPPTDARRDEVSGSATQVVGGADHVAASGVGLAADQSTSAPGPIADSARGGSHA